VLAWTRAVPASDEGEAVKVNNGRVYHLPLGLTLINKFFNVELKPSEVEGFMKDEAHAKALFDAFFRGYTSKQWAKAPEDIDPSIIKRVPVRSNYDINYFNDYWQGIPSEGYNTLFERLLDHPNIKVQCNSTLRVEGRGGGGENGRFVIFDEVKKTSYPLPTSSSSLHLYYSGPIDALFNYKFGALPWRTLRFERETLDIPDYQGTSVVNYPDVDIPYTRVHEFKHYHPEAKGHVEKIGGGGERAAWGFDAPKTVILREYSSTWQMGDEPYYPVNNPESTALFAKYQDEVVRLTASLVVGGRLGQYKYFDMDKSVEAALKADIL